ncbi:MAG: TonB-dependent receptor [Nevskia sp.]|nr:TonB-dependent receptor [Nevskia sp.]
MDAVVVTGTRAPDRTALRSSSPVDVISADTLAATGYPDLGRALEFAEPSANFPRPQTTPSAANTRAITLRGLSPDEVLVLVNGRRWHTSAVVNVNFAVGRGSAPFDLSTIPVAAVERIEVLRDGAAAQYGSDAIAGVINIILKSNTSGGYAQLQGGATSRGDGDNLDGSFNTGLRLGDGGRLTISGEGSYQDSTNRAAVDGRFQRTTFRIGDPQAINGSVAASAMVPVMGGARLYDDLLLSRRDSGNAGAFDAPGTSPLYPNGFLPIINPLIWDVGNSVGLRGELPQAFRYDLSNTFGYSDAAFHVYDSANASLGTASPTTFDAGSEAYLQDVTSFTLNRPLPELPHGGNLATGIEARYESYRIGQGDAASTAGAGSAGFPGFNPHLPVDNARGAGAAFVDLELKPLRWLSLGGAGRYDRYSDFGGAPTWKASFRAETVQWLALRGSASTGFRAPSLQQEYYSSITTVANGGASKSLVNVGTFQVGDPVAQALGAQPLQAEKSRDFSLGLVATPLRTLWLTADLFRTDIDRRIALSDALSGPAVTAALANAGITNVQQVAFFTNAFNTRTQGYDLSGKFRGDLSDDLDYLVALGYARSPTEVRSRPAVNAPAGLVLNGTHSTLLLTQAQPADKLNAELALYSGPCTVTLDVTRFGKYTDAPIAAPQTFGAKTIVDLSLTAQLNRRLSLTVGVLNLGDVFPDPLSQTGPSFPSYKTFGGSYVYGEESPWGTDGLSYYARLRFEL